ncbi:alpha/beta hydrolase [Azospirillum sp. A29]|uniref:alpha/beta fold hydrolase n=1 Tax=Azospirillum sp. A29 TaxID=3160606 RepID=UPI0036712011
MAGDTLKTDLKTAPTRHVEVAGTRFAYRRLGSHGGVPVVLLNHWAANLDNFDPPLVEGLAADRPALTIRTPVLVANGDSDIMVPSENSIALARRIPGAKLVLYRDTGHGGIFQHHDAFLMEARAFFAA